MLEGIKYISEQKNWSIGDLQYYVYIIIIIFVFFFYEEDQRYRKAPILPYSCN